MKQVGDVLRAARKASGLSCSEVGGRLGVSEGTIYAWERGQNDVGSTMLLKLCQIYGISFDDFAEIGSEDERLKEMERLYDGMNEVGRTAALAVMKGLFNEYGKEQQ